MMAPGERMSERSDPRRSKEHCHHDEHDAVACPRCVGRARHAASIKAAADKIKEMQPRVGATGRQVLLPSR